MYIVSINQLLFSNFSFTKIVVKGMTKAEMVLKVIYYMHIISEQVFVQFLTVNSTI